MRIKLFFSICIIGLSLSSTCHKERPPRELFMPDEVKDYALFKTGTWWQYTDTATQETRFIEVYSDSVFMQPSYVNHKRDIADWRENFIWTTNEAEYHGYILSGDTSGSTLQASVGKGLLGPGEDNTYWFYYPFIPYSLKPHGSTALSLHAI